MIKIIGLLIIAGIFCIYRVIKELRKINGIELIQDDYDEY